jgi:hypothetical protein
VPIGNASFGADAPAPGVDPDLLSGLQVAGPGSAKLLVGVLPNAPQIDTNANGKIDPAELYGRLTEVFYLNDTNRDGFLDATEYGAAIARPGSFDQTDTNHDGKISLQEFYRDRATLWEQADTDDDQALTFEEVEQAWTPAKPQ